MGMEHVGVLERRETCGNLATSKAALVAVLLVLRTEQTQGRQSGATQKLVLRTDLPLQHEEAQDGERGTRGHRVARDEETCGKG